MNKAYYQQKSVLTTNISNNAFSFHQRKKIQGTATITIPALIHGTLDDLAVGDDIVFEEIDHSGQLLSCKGLQHMLRIDDSTQPHTAPIYIIDNHNHALYHRLHELSKASPVIDQIDLIHIDQHSDLARPSKSFDQTQRKYQDYQRYYTNHVCNVGNFIKPFLSIFPSTNFLRIKSETQLLQHLPNPTPGHNPYRILDIDLDFRAPDMSIQKVDQTIQAIKRLIAQASLVTIATSPYFLDQKEAIQLLNILL